MASKKPARKLPLHQVETRKVADLKPHPKNSRRHSDSQISQIAASVEANGWTTPILIDDKNTILAGEGRWRAAQRLGLQEVSVIVAKGWSAKQKRAYMIADNAIAAGSEWDLDMLRGEMLDLKAQDLDLTLLGFGEDALKDILAPPADDAPKGKRKSSGLGEAVIGYNIVFDDEAQQQVWFGFLRKLKADYPAQETIGARLAQVIADKKLGA